MPTDPPDNITNRFQNAFKAIDDAIAKSKKAFAEAFADPHATPVMSDTAKKLPSELREYIEPVIRETGLWEDRLKERFGVEILYDIDWPGFTGQPERNALALIQLKEVGVDWLYYALTGLADKDPALAALIPRRLRVLRLLHVATAAEKSLTASGNALELRLALHKDYTGYLTLADMTPLLPGLLAGMPEVPRAAAPPEPPPPQLPAAADAAREDFKRARSDAIEALVNADGNILGFMGRPVRMAIDWPAVGTEAETVWALLNASLSPVIAGIAVFVQDAAKRAVFDETVGAILLRPFKNISRRDAGPYFSLEGKTLVYNTPERVHKPYDSFKAAEMLERLLMPPKAKGRKTKYKPQAKPKPKARAKPIAKAKRKAMKKPAGKAKRKKR